MGSLRAAFVGFRRPIPPLLLTAGVILALALPGSAGAATPGKIAFTSNRVGQSDDEIWLMNGDGTNQVPITNTTTDERDPSWSPDGQQIAFFSDRDAGGENDLWVMNADGSNQHQLTNGFNAGSVDWAPDGKSLVFSRFLGTNDDLWIVNADGSGLHQLVGTPTGTYYYGPHFSPDGQWIVFTNDTPTGSDVLALITPAGTQQHNINGIDSYAPDFTADGKRLVFTSDQLDAGSDNEIGSMNIDGSDIRQLTFNSGTGSNDAASSPSRDGLNRIAFRSNRDAEHNNELFVMNADGSGVTQLTHDPTGTSNRSPDWQPNVVCRGKVATIVGTSAAETLTGGPGPDVISGQGGKDTINGLDGADIVCGDDGKDIVNGGNGNDLIDGGKGNDKLSGGTGKDKLFGGKGNDKLNGGKGKDTCNGGKGKKDTAKNCEKEKKIP
jgi:Tol biopolymer transport system component